MKENLYINIKASATKISGEIRSLVTYMNSLGKSASNSAKNFAGLFSKLRQNNNAFANVTKDANRANTSIKSVTSSFTGLNKAMGMMSSYLIANTFANSVQSAMSMIETVNLFNVSLGEMATTANETVESLNKVFGFDTTNIQNAVGTYSLLARSMGMSGKNAEILSTNTYKLAADLSSLTNVPLNQVMQDLRSGLIGQSETVYKYGIDVTEASIKSEAMAQGISKSVRNMSQGEKMALRYSVMLKQTTLAQGDFAKTINSPANQLKIIGERFVTLSRNIGTLFIPTLTKILPLMNAFLRVLNEMVASLAKLFGYEAPKIGSADGLKSVTDDADSATDAVEGVGKAMKGLTSGMDELNVLNTDTTGAGGTGAIAGGAEYDLTGYDNLSDKVISTSDKMYESINKALEKFRELSAPLENASFGMLSASFNNLIDSIKEFGEIPMGAFTWFYENVLVPIGTYAINDFLPLFFIELSEALKVLKELLDAASPAFDSFWNTFLEPIGKWAGDLLLNSLQDNISSLRDFSNWIKDNKPLIEDITTFVLDLAAAYTTFRIALGLWSIIGAIATVITGGLSVALAILTSPVTLIILAIGLLAAGLIYAYEHSEAFRVKVSEIGDNIKILWDTFKLFIKFLGELFVESIKGIGKVIKDTFNSIVDSFKGVLKIFSGILFQNWSMIWEGFKDVVKAVINTVISIIETFINSFINTFNIVSDLVNGIIDMINSISSLTKVKIEFRMSKAANITLPKLARGGMLGEGDLFQAGEFGKAEMLGSYNGKTTVMPLENTDFVNAIYDAVYNAMSNVDMSGQVIENVLTLDGETIYKNQQKVSRSRGANFNMGAFTR